MNLLKQPWSVFARLYVREIHVYNKGLPTAMSAGSNLLFSDEETETRETKRCVHGHKTIFSVDCPLK